MPDPEKKTQHAKGRPVAGSREGPGYNPVEDFSTAISENPHFF